MECKIEIKDLELICGIVDSGFGHVLLSSSKDCGVSGRTIMLGRRVVDKHALLNLFGLAEEKMEVVLMLADSQKVAETYKKLVERFRHEEKEMGIVFTTSVNKVIGTRNCISGTGFMERGERETMYKVMTVIVERGRAELAVEQANKNGALCVTIINGRGAGVHETSKLFSMEIEPEKEVIIIISHNDQSDDIISSIREKLDMEKPGNGLIYIQDINDIYGLEG
jgi:nitrogen regulatory protein PII